MPDKNLLYYLDTNICISFLRNKNKILRDKFLSYPQENIKIPAVVAAELMHGAYKSKEQERNLIQVKSFLSEFEIISFDYNAALLYGKIRASLENNGNNIGPNDLFIASSVLSLNGILVTNNVREFSRVEGLIIEDWTT